jgi:uncharacterized membrane protein YkvA (DUF1232 family)
MRAAEARALARFVPDCIVLFTRLLGDARVPRRWRGGLALVVAYLAFPLDLIPDFIPVVGFVDDAVLVALALRAILRAAGPEAVLEHWPGPARTLSTVLRLSAA